MEELIRLARMKAYAQIRYIDIQDVVDNLWDWIRPKDLVELYVYGDMAVEEFEHYLDLCLGIRR